MHYANISPQGLMKRAIVSLSFITSMTLLGGCDVIQDDDSDIALTPLNAVVQTKAPDYSSSAVAYVDFNSQTVSGDYYVKDKSDYTITSNGSDVYHLGRSSIDTVDKYHSQSPDELIYSASTNDSGEVTSSNPYTLVFASDTKAYLIRYGSDKVWIVNPNTTDAQHFKIGELDLSAYTATGSTQTTPTASGAVIVDDQLYIVMQRYAINGYQWDINPTYVAVFDIHTDMEIETNSVADDNLKGILLSGLNPLENSIKAAFGHVYVTSRSAYTNTDLSLSMIEKIDIVDYKVSRVLTAEDIVDNNNAFITSSEIVSATQGYFVASQSGFNADNIWSTTSTLYEFNPSSGEIVTTHVADTGTEEISYIGLDDANFLWLSVINPATPGIDVMNTSTNLLEGSRLLTGLNPSKIAFVK